jgi:D-alanine--poly(phosphoribitol) ligase subunit 2
MRDYGDSRGLIRAKIVELAKELGRNASRLQDHDLIPQSGVLDSASLMSLVVWFEEEFGVSTEVDELNLDNFGTIDLMVDYLKRHG